MSILLGAVNITDCETMGPFFSLLSSFKIELDVR